VLLIGDEVGWIVLQFLNYLCQTLVDFSDEWVMLLLFKVDLYKSDTKVHFLHFYVVVAGDQLHRFLLLLALLYLLFLLLL